MDTFLYSNYLFEELSSSVNPTTDSCTSCVLLQCKISTTIRDGVQRTITTRELQLCSAHLKHDTAQSLDLILSISSQIILNSINVGVDPLHILDNPTTSPQTASPQHTPNEPAATMPPTFPTAATESAAGPIRHRRSSTRDDHEAKIHDKYPQILSLVNSGSSLNTAIKSAGVGRSSFFKYRYLAELKLVNNDRYNEIRDQCTTTSKFCERCKSTLMGDLKQQTQEMRVDKKLLP